MMTTKRLRAFAVGLLVLAGIAQHSTIKTVRQMAVDGNSITFNF